MFVCEFSGGYKAILVLILSDENVIGHLFMKSIIGRVAMTLKLLLQIFFNLEDMKGEVLSCTVDTSKKDRNLLYNNC